MYIDLTNDLFVEAQYLFPLILTLRITDLSELGDLVPN